MSQFQCFIVDAFETGNKEKAVRLLPQIQQPAKVRSGAGWESSLLHYATRHGWLDVVIELATKYKCDVNCKDKLGFTPLHDAAMNDQLKVLINDQHCDPMKHQRCRCLGAVQCSMYGIQLADA